MKNDMEATPPVREMELSLSLSHTHTHTHTHTHHARKRPSLFVETSKTPHHLASCCTRDSGKWATKSLAHVTAATLTQASHTLI
ncbi:hypothetical protein LZ32DRAFT_399838 [Colletotrichum eremochloae]|nr:hypothetical protein LZ32DRAFT_399838 [Colletotrichum eremochloae]